MKQWISAIVLTSVLLGISGCQDTVNTMGRAKAEMKPVPIETQNFVTDNFCRDRIKCISVSRSEAPGGLMTVQVRLRSERYGFCSEIWSWFMGDNPYHVNCRFDWFDAKGMQVRTAASDWQRIIFQPGETKSLQSVAPNASCKDFVLNLQEYSFR